MANSPEFELPPAKAGKKQPTPIIEIKEPPIVEEAEQPKKEKEKEKPKYSEEELLSVFDDLIFNGTYSEKVLIKGKLQVTFRTRSAEEIEAISLAIDSTKANLVTTITEKRSVLNLYYALTSYQGTNLSNMKIEEKSAYLNKLAAPILGMLMTELSNFDNKVWEATKLGEQNF